MAHGRLKINQFLDEVFAFYIKCRDEWRCQICLGQFSVNFPHLDCSHFFARRHAGTRTDEENADAFCRNCHQKLEHEKAVDKKYYVFKIRQLGADKLEMLEQRARAVFKTTNQDKLDKVEELLEKIEQLGYETEELRKKYEKSCI